MIFVDKRCFFLAADNMYIKTCPVLDKSIQQELIDILSIQLQDNTKARILDNELQNEYVKGGRKKVRSQEAIYDYLFKKTVTQIETGSH